MNHEPHEHDDLERELMGMRPAAASGDLRQRIARALHERTPMRRGWLAGLAAAAAWMMLGITLWQTAPGDGRRDERVATRQGAPPPTLWAYHAAAAQSPQEFERLLDAHARSLPRVAGAPMFAGRF